MSFDNFTQWCEEIELLKSPKGQTFTMQKARDERKRREIDRRKQREEERRKRRERERERGREKERDRERDRQDSGDGVPQFKVSRTNTDHFFCFVQTCCAWRDILPFVFGVACLARKMLGTCGRRPLSMVVCRKKFYMQLLKNTERDGEQEGGNKNHSNQMEERSNRPKTWREKEAERKRWCEAVICEIDMLFVTMDCAGQGVELVKSKW